MEQDQILDSIRKLVRSELPEAKESYLFGSWAKGSALPTSDIDIAVGGSLPLDEDKVASLRRLLETIPTLRKIDLVDLGRIDDTFRTEILKHARPL